MARAKQWLMMMMTMKMKMVSRKTWRMIMVKVMKKMIKMSMDRNRMDSKHLPNNSSYNNSNTLMHNNNKSLF